MEERVKVKGKKKSRGQKSQKFKKYVRLEKVIKKRHRFFEKNCKYVKSTHLVKRSHGRKSQLFTKGHIHYFEKCLRKKVQIFYYRCQKSNVRLKVLLNKTFDGVFN